MTRDSGSSGWSGTTQSGPTPSGRWSAGPPVPTGLIEVLAESRARGLLGPGDAAEHVVHARGFATALTPGARVLDMGSGGGIPGLPLALGRPDLSVTLLDSAARRTRFLEWGVERLGVSERVAVVHARAEEAAASGELRGSFDFVVARLFGPPAVTAECARPFLTENGSVLISEPPPESAVEHDRWPQEGLEQLGLHRSAEFRSEGNSYVCLMAVGPCPQHFPRRVGVAAKRPLF